MNNSFFVIKIFSNLISILISLWCPVAQIPRKKRVDSRDFKNVSCESNEDDEVTLNLLEDFRWLLSYKYCKSFISGFFVFYNFRLIMTEALQSQTGSVSNLPLLQIKVRWAFVRLSEYFLTVFYHSFSFVVFQWIKWFVNFPS